MKRFLTAISTSGSHELSAFRALAFKVCLISLGCNLASAQEIPPGTTLDLLDPYETQQTIGLTQLRAIHPEANGSGVYIVQPEAPSGNNDYQVNPSPVAQPQSFFTYFDQDEHTSNVFPNAIGNESWHANAVASLFYGQVNGSNPEGVAFGASHVDNHISSGFFLNVINGNPAPSTGKVVNESFIFGLSPNADLQMDNYIARFGTIIVSGVGNGGAPPYSPATCYDGLGVAAFGGASSVGPTSENGRSKPDITAPAKYTSFSTPLFLEQRPFSCRQRRELRTRAT